jgi:hypothetical protein
MGGTAVTADERRELDRLRARVAVLEVRAGIRQAGECGLYLGCGENCGLPAGHHGTYRTRHLSPRDPAFKPWGEQR